MTTRGKYFAALSWSAGFVLLPAMIWSAAHAQSEPTAYKGDPVALVRDASYNELKPSDSARVRYKLRKTDEKGVTVKEIIETPDGDVARLLAHGDQPGDEPLNDEQERAEAERLNNLYAHPEIQAHRHKKEQEDSGRADTMIKMLPDAFIYTYEGMAEGLSGPAYRLSFAPNPKFIPPSREAEVYHGMAGELWIDARERRMAKFDAHLISDVDFGWGIVGRLFKGGTILVEQKDVGGGRWETVNMKLNLTGKILMMKGLSIQTTETGSDYVSIPKATDYKAAIEILKSLPPVMK